MRPTLLSLALFPSGDSEVRLSVFPRSHSCYRDRWHPNPRSLGSHTISCFGFPSSLTTPEGQDGHGKPRLAVPCVKQQLPSAAGTVWTPWLFASAG